MSLFHSDLTAMATINLSKIPALLKRDGIQLPKGWKMSLVERERNDWQGFVESPCGDTASLVFARECGTTSGDDIPLPDIVRSYIMRPEFDQYE